MNTPHSALNIAIVIGSVREGRIGSHIGAWALDQLSREPIGEDRIEPDLIDIAGYTFPASMHGHPDVEVFAKRIDAADGVIVITPEYNHSFPGPLKTAIDSVRAQWQAKPVGFISYGGMAGGARAVEALRLVFAELHAATIRDTVTLHNPWQPLTDPTVDYPDAAAAQALRSMGDQLAWWAQALRQARTEKPYPG
ncbi:MAG: NADPH-dependent FMN reductase [Pseudonocardiaceae bacterium]